MIHRDVKPENILIDDDGQVVLSDFGVSALVEDGGPTPTRSVAYSEAYAAPEVLETNTYGTASDVYAPAATGYAMLSGQAPFDGATGARRLLAITPQEPAPITTTHRGQSGPCLFTGPCKLTLARLLKNEAPVLRFRHSMPAGLLRHENFPQTRVAPVGRAALGRVPPYP